MRSSWAVLLVASLPAVTASVPFYDQSRNPRPVVASNVKPLGNDVPGENPLQFCDGNQDHYSVHIGNVDLTPNPPVPGSTLTINAYGNVTKTIEPGSTCNIQVKYGLIKLLTQEVDMCEQMSNVDMECPIQEGRLVIQKDVDIPREVPPGTYTVVANCTHPDGRSLITCLKATITFGIGLFGK